MLLYQGTPYVKGNVFVDPVGAKLTFDRSTKKGKLFVSEKGSRMCLTENQVNRLRLLNEALYKKSAKVIGAVIKFDGFDEEIMIMEKSLKHCNYYPSSFDKDNVIGYICFDVGSVKLGSFTLDNLMDYIEKGSLSIMLDDFTEDDYTIYSFSPLQKIQDNIYMYVFEGIKE